MPSWTPCPASGYATSTRHSPRRRSGVPCTVGERGRRQTFCQMALEETEAMQHVRPVDRRVVAGCHTRPARAGSCQAGDGDPPLSSHGDDLLAAPDGDGTGAGGRLMIVGSALWPCCVTFRPSLSRPSAETSPIPGLPPPLSLSLML